jgi:hypothetical protein
MITLCTPDDVLRYIYGETDAEESVLMEQILAEDGELQVFYKQMQQLKNQIEKIRLSPPSGVIERIFNYSRLYR